MNPGNTAKEKHPARRIQAVRLLILLCASLAAGFFAASCAEYFLSSFAPSRSLQPAAAHQPSEPFPGAADQASAGHLLDLNTASYEELLTLPGIGPALAREILNFRESSGPFYFPEDLMDVRGIGDRTFQALKYQITCNPVP